jgi:glycosyltransferase involved in cell wall biosynthesis
MAIRSRAAPSRSDAPPVSVIVPHYRDLSGLDRCLSALEIQTYPKRRFEVIVADNASPEGADIVAATIRGRARLVVVTERGAGPARNGGVAASRRPILAFTDSDCVPEPQWLAKGVAALDRFDVVGGRVKVLVPDPARMTPEEAFESVFAFDFKTYIEKKGFTGAGNLFCSRATFERAGGFRVGLSEDVEWSRRATAGGARLGYEPQAVVGHPARATWAELRDKWRRLNLETFGLMAAQPHQRLRWLARSLLLPASAVAHTPRVLFSRELPGLRERLAALGVLYRLRLWRMADALAMLRRS